ncbi:lactonase family protein [Hydrogenophaga sp. 2FB]|uniref:lactonase family protein n=1 Tax=Hydrogenophaga sp. 2FB TaxID=2502187 RepID=UPI0010F9A271|nr:lactonase family protein [Hydrogenophaga sp. 2FB]
MLATPSWLAYVGCRTTRERHAQGRGLGVYRVDSTGTWRLIQQVEDLRNPSFLCLHPHQPRLYAIHGDFSEVSSFAIAANGHLEMLGEQTTHGSNPTHLALTASARWLLIANYASGNVASIAVSALGDLGAGAHVLALPGSSGPHAQQDGSHPHQICFTPDGRYAMVPDKGLDKVFALASDDVGGRLDIANSLTMTPGSGPRHMVFHPTLSLAYIVGELDRTVTTVQYDKTNGHLHTTAVRSTVPTGHAHGSAAGIVLSPDGHRLFVSNRGHDSVAMFDVGTDGVLGSTVWLPAGKTPRFITVTPQDGHLLVAREDGHSIAAHQSADTFNELVQTGSPVCIVFQKEKP